MDTATRLRVIADARRRGVEQGRREAEAEGLPRAARITALEQRVATLERTISDLIETLSHDATRRLERLDDREHG